jgi:uncharacterized protein (TIGR02145 family)
LIFIQTWYNFDNKRSNEIPQGNKFITMKRYLKIPVIIFLSIGLMVILQSCKKTTLPVVITVSVSGITQTNAVSGGNVIDNGGDEVTARGVCWGPTPNPTTANSKTTDGSGNGPFISNITGLSDGTTYFVRAYATNSAGTSYGEEYSFISSITDFEGNVYETVLIGTQVWMKENLKTTKYRYGLQIPNITNLTQWASASTGAYCWYDNDQASYKDTYGALYNWFTVSTGNLCPIGWHVPIDPEWTTLITYLGGETVAGGKLKETGIAHWASPNTGATDEKGFKALPGACRFTGTLLDPDGFAGIGSGGIWWSASEFDAATAWASCIVFNESKIFKANLAKNVGNSVRCIKN